MTKSELIDKISSDTNISKDDAGRVLTSAFDHIAKALEKGESVTLVGFGTFDVSERKARKGRNPQTGETIKIPAMKVPRFKAGKSFREIVSGKKKQS